MSSDVFQLTTETRSAFDRHGADTINATKAERKQAREAALQHLEDVFLAREYAAQRLVDQARRQAEYEAAEKAKRIDATRHAWQVANVGTVEGLCAFFCSTLGGTVTSCTPTGDVGNKASAADPGEAATQLKGQKSEGLFSASLPAGLFAIRYTPEMFELFNAKNSTAGAVRWEIGGHVYTLHAGQIKRDVDAGPIAFMQYGIRCGMAANWQTEPSAAKLDDEARPVSIPGDVLESVNHCTAGAEKLLLKLVV